MKIKHYLLSALALTLGFGGGAGAAAVKVQAEGTSQTYTASTGFSITQGQNQWSYLKKSGAVFSDLVYNTTNKRWQPDSTGYPWVTANAQHPDANFDSVRKWVAPGSGTISITGSVSKGDSLGDGILATIMKDSTTLWSSVVTSPTAVNPTGVTNIPVTAGSSIYFIVNKRTTTNNDHTLWNPSVNFTPTYQAANTSSSTLTTTTETAAAEISVISCGATPNDSTDDYPAFAAAIDKAKKSGAAVYVPAGNYRLSKILTLDGVSLRGAGKEVTTLTSTDPYKGSIDIKGDGVKLSGIKHVYNTVVPRGDGANEKNSITVRGATHFTIDNVYVSKASTAGILVMGAAHNGAITNSTVEGTNADGIHITDASYTITISNNTVKGVGDDTIAVVSYKEDIAAARDITIKGNDVGYMSKARGITVVGGSNVLIENNSVKDTMMAGIYIAVEGNYNTYNVNEIKINSNTVDHTGIQEPQNHPNVLVYASQGTIDNVIFNNNLFKNAAHRGLGVWGTGNIKNVYFTKNTLINNIGDATVFTSGLIHLTENIGF
ncbi:glycosyl hydrolase family 28-related protein [Paenibacillus sp. JX-17]|uniref:Glycosyl hydrolase family 28-related protein n=1 Tax=Paenibacillus lacisoli TaxID=3064525 RepID=A0ABT9CGL7_9BACL|nr:right-handed parallel beta-helix repeat-containing protein [Paenibacillus sp. JX-17]MDO7908402.1 glycosyl hydrolase family 28-related protein [Paenibacillus sp. JX-17]